MLCLLDINEPGNEELLKQMKKKKLRMLFVRKERVLSQKTERSDDLYGLAKIMEFTAEKCLDPKAFTRKEERVWKRMLGKCYSSGKNAIKVLKNMQKEIGFLEREMERPRDKVSAKKDFARNSGGLYHECSNHRRDSEKAGKQKRLQRIRISQRREFRKE
mgnify:CR=1 FL=1